MWETYTVLAYMSRRLSFLPVNKMFGRHLCRAGVGKVVLSTLALILALRCPLHVFAPAISDSNIQSAFKRKSFLPNKWEKQLWAYIRPAIATAAHLKTYVNPGCKWATNNSSSFIIWSFLCEPFIYTLMAEKFFKHVKLPGY